jgi:hypothetical protein
LHNLLLYLVAARGTIALAASVPNTNLEGQNRMKKIKGEKTEKKIQLKDLKANKEVKGGIRRRLN